MGKWKKNSAGLTMLLILVLLVSLGGVLVGAAFWEDTNQLHQEMTVSVFPERTSLQLNTIIETALERIGGQAPEACTPFRTVIQREAATWNIYEYRVQLAGSETLTRFVDQLSKAIYHSGGEIFQQYIQPEEHQVTIVIGIGAFITHTLVLTWQSPVTPETTIVHQDPATTPPFKAAIVIDDLGANTQAVLRLLDLNEDFTFSVLPHLQHSTHIASLLHEHQKEILLHLPMEARNSSENPGKGAIMSYMEITQIQHMLENNLRSIPFAVGANNHMGSRITAEPEKIRIVLEHLHHHHLFFLDSRTTASSVAYDVAQRLNLKSAARKVFLDADVPLNAVTVKARLRELAELAEQGQPAIAIGHPKEVTLQALQEILPEFKQRNIQIVRVSQFVH
ncbi:MAG: divergent polysaccharide deacetylase family protein [Candidatus Vecturithrix sp.]|nr:divergent polysaccharide deacetylase family protein [Candidatus Vecturithrix sp.]